MVVFVIAFGGGSGGGSGCRDGADRGGDGVTFVMLVIGVLASIWGCLWW